VFISRIWGENPLNGLSPNFVFFFVDVRDIITCFKFGDDRLRDLGSAEGQSLPYPIDFDGRPYNTHTTVWACDHISACVCICLYHRCKCNKRSDKNLKKTFKNVIKGAKNIKKSFANVW